MPVSEVSVCVDGNVVTAYCGNVPTVGQVGTQFSVSCDGQTINILVDSSGEGGSVFYSVNSDPSQNTTLVLDSSGICTSLTP